MSFALFLCRAAAGVTLSFSLLVSNTTRLSNHLVDETTVERVLASPSTRPTNPTPEPRTTPPIDAAAPAIAAILTALPLTAADAATVTTTAMPSTTVSPTTSVPPSTTTGCTAVAHVGDSLSVPLTSPDYLPHKSDRIDAQYHTAGVKTVLMDSTGGRSIVETVGGQPNAKTGVMTLRNAGHDGCWVFAMGTNDAANYAVGSSYGNRARIDIMIAAANNKPVLWPTVKTLRSTGPYADSEMTGFNDALRAACARYPNLRVYDWSAEVEDDWFQDDGIHFTSHGYAERARRLATALARAFPSTDESSACVVSGA